MRIIIIGGTGTIGKAVAQELGQRHEMIIAARDHGDIQLDITNPASIENMYHSVKNLDAVISTTGKVEFKELTEFSAEDYFVGLKNKLMGQINLVLIGMKHINDKGSFTLTSGILNEDPIRFGSSAAMVNGALNGFVRSVAIEMPRDLRINVISPTVIAESMAEYGPFFRGFDAVPVAKVALAFSKSVEGLQTGQIYKVGY